MVYLQTDCLKTDVKYGTNRKDDVMFNGNMRVSQPHASKYYIKMSRSRKKFPAGVNCCCKSQKKGKKVASKRFRRKVKVLMHQESYERLPFFSIELTSPWDLGGDGKSFYGFRSECDWYEKVMRK